MANFNLTDQTNLFKINYYKKSENMYNSYNVLHGRIKKKYDFVGRQKFVSVPTSFSGGVGAGTLPTANAGTYDAAIITAKKVYARAEIDRESIKASQGKQGAFVEATRETVQKTVESYMRNCSRILFGDGSGALGTSTAVNATGSAAAPVIIITEASWNEANWEEKDYINFNSDSSVFEIDDVNVATKTVTLARISGSLDLTGTGGGDVAYMQNSKDLEPQGLKGIVDATVGVTSLYGITAKRRWSATVSDKSGAGINPDMMNEIMLGLERSFGKVPNMICTSYTQLQKILEFLEDQKVYNLPNKNIKGALSFQGVEFMSTRGPIGIFADRFCDADRMYFINDRFFESHHRPGFGWFDDDGTVFLRNVNSDDYEARYGGYYENYIVPTSVGCLKGLAV